MVSRHDRDREYHDPRSSNCTDADFVSHKNKYVPDASPLGSPPRYTSSPCLESGHNDKCATSQIQMKDKCDSSAYVRNIDGILQTQKEKRDKHEYTDTVPSIPNESEPPHESDKLGSQVYGPTPILSKEKSDQMHEDKTQDDNSQVDNSFMAAVEFQSTKHQMQTSNLANNSHDVQDEQVNAFNTIEENANENSQEEPSVTCPYCQISLHNNVVLKEHIDDMHRQKLFPCHLCDFTTTDKDTFANHIVSWHQVAQAVQEGESILGHPLLEVFSKTTDMAWSSLKKVMNQLDLVKVEVPGNGFCFISSLLVALAEQGINKNYDILSIDIMNEIDRYYESMIDETGFSLGNKEDFSQICASFFEEGNYTHEYVDVCIGSAANALGINVTIFQRTVNSVMKINQTCEKFKSKVHVCLIFHNRQKCKKNNDCHYNPILHRQYYKKNEQAVKSRMVVTRQNGESDGQQIRNDFELAQ